MWRSAGLRALGGAAGGPARLAADAVVAAAARVPVVLFGERHHEPAILRAQLALLAGLARALQQRGAALALVLEPFHFGLDPVLEAFSRGHADVGDVQQACAREGDGYDPQHYGELLVAARALGVRVHAGFVPRTLAQAVYKEGLDVALARAEALYGMPRAAYVPGTEAHYAQMHRLLRGPDAPVTDGLRGLFAAQVLKDSAMAWRIRTVATGTHAGPAPVHVLAVCGSGHVDYGYGVPERLGPGLPSYTITTRTHGVQGQQQADEDGVADCVLQYTPDASDDGDDDDDGGGGGNDHSHSHGQGTRPSATP
jgi:uncharacterized iron-regulated protein